MLEKLYFFSQILSFCCLQFHNFISRRFFFLRVAVSPAAVPAPAVTGLPGDVTSSAFAHSAARSCRLDVVSLTPLAACAARR